MRYRKLDADNDYVFGNGQKDFYRDVPAAVGQAALTRLLLWLGEWYLDITEGTPYIQGVLGKHGKTQADVTIQDRVLNTQGLTTIEDYNSEIDPNTRGMDVSFNINTIFGPTQLQVDNYANF